jgi:fucose permease
MAVVLVGLSMLLRVIHLPDIDTDKDEVSPAKAGSKKNYLIQFPHLILGFIAMFLYVGAEVISVDTIIPYGQSLGFTLKTARLFSSYALAAMVFGYILGIIAMPRFISQSKALAISAVLGIIYTIASIVTSGYVSIAFLALLGMANALMWPAIWPLAIADLGKFIKSGSALLIMGILGGATLPLMYGFLSEKWHSNQQAYWILVPIYVFIFYFATTGHKIRK